MLQVAAVGREREREGKIRESKGGVSTLVVLGLLRGLHGLSDLHTDDVNLCLAVLQHLLSRLEQLLVLQRHQKRDRTTLLGSYCF